MDIQNIEKLLGARYVDSYVSGHMGSQILRFQRNTDKIMLVVKFAFMDNVGAIADIEANIRGYAEIRSLGGLRLVPLELKEIPVKNGKAVIMRDLGVSMRIADDGFDAYVSLWKHFRRVIVQTTAQINMSSVRLPPFVTEVVQQIERFSYGNTLNLLGMIKEFDWTGEWGKPAIMPLDFTPDNLFLSETELLFIDPWNQKTYLGNPAVSIGQFATLIKLYCMRDAEEAAHMLEERCLAEIPSMLDCEVLSVKRSFCLGSILQFVLSAYVRRESDPHRAIELIKEAHKLW